MKKHLTNAIGKKVFTLLTASVILFGSASSSFALPERAANTIKAANIYYNGVKGQYVVFKVDYKNEQAEAFELVIKNEQNDILYSKKFDAKPLNTDVLLSELPEACKLTFSIKSGKKDFSQSFEINTNYKTVAELEVKGI